MKAKREIMLWRLHPVTGYWQIVQGPFVSDENAQRYLEVFQKSEPGVTFKLSSRRPKYS